MGGERWALCSLSLSASAQTSAPFYCSLLTRITHISSCAFCVNLSCHHLNSFPLLLLPFSPLSNARFFTYFCPSESVKTFIKAVPSLFFHCLKHCLGETHSIAIVAGRSIESGPRRLFRPILKICAALGWLLVGILPRKG